MVNISLRDSETHFDRKPSHKIAPKAVRDALDYAHNCAQEFNDMINKMYTPGTPHPGMTEITRLANQANDAEKALREARWAALNDDSLQECTCRPDADYLCPVCKAYTDAKYGDDIPFRGE